MAFYVVDRLEGKTAVIVADEGATYDVARSDLPKGCREGTVLRLERMGEPINWAGAEIDEAERLRRLERGRATLDRLSRSDPGGDVDL